MYSLCLQLEYRLKPLDPWSPTPQPWYVRFFILYAKPYKHQAEIPETIELCTDVNFGGDCIKLPMGNAFCVCFTEATGLAMLNHQVSSVKFSHIRNGGTCKFYRYESAFLSRSSLCSLFDLIIGRTTATTSTQWSSKIWNLRLSVICRTLASTMRCHASSASTPRVGNVDFTLSVRGLGIEVLICRWRNTQGSHLVGLVTLRQTLKKKHQH